MFGKDFCDKKTISKKLNRNKELIESRESTKHHCEVALVSYLLNDPINHSKTSEVIKECEEKIQDLQNENAELEELLHELDKSTETQSNLDQDNGSDNNNKLQEEADKFKENEKKFREQFGAQESRQREQESRQNESLFHKFHAFSQEFQEFKSEEEDIEAQSGEGSTIQVEDLFKDTNSAKSAVKTAILFVATFFPQLSIHNFEKVILFLFKDQKINVSVQSKITNEKEGIQVAEAIEQQLLSQVWRDSVNNREAFLGECCLKVWRTKDDIRIVDFSPPSLRAELREYFEQKFELTLYLEQQFKLTRFLIFDTSESTRIAINAIDLCVEMAIANPDIYGKSWLCQISEFIKILELAKEFISGRTIGIEQWLQIFTLEYNEESKQELKLFDQLLRPIEESQKGQFVLVRISALLAEMLKHPQLKPEVESFLDWAIKNKQQQAIVLEIIKPLQSVSHFDQLYWVKKLLDQGTREVRDKAYIFLFSCLDQSNEQIYSVLESVFKWLPERSKTGDRYSPSNEYSLQLLFDYSFEKFSELSPREYGRYPSKYPLFQPFKDSMPDQSLRLLIDWLFHPGLKYLINPGASPVEITGAVLSQWFNVLWGNSKEEPPAPLMALIQQLIGQVKASVDRTQQRELIQFWNTLTDQLLNQVECYSRDGDDREKCQLIQQRNVVRQLKQQFKGA